MFESVASWLLLPLGIALGWYVARRVPSRSGRAGPASYMTSDPVLSLGDEALDALLDATADSPISLDLHLTLGTSLRKRGEVDRALHLHETLQQRALSPEEHDRVRYELALDYSASGMMDRAESLFQALVQEGVYAAESLRGLRALHEQSREWQAALDANRQLEAITGESQQAYAAQYCCEIAMVALSEGEVRDARDWATRASGLDRDTPRPWMLLAQIHERQGEAEQAGACFEKVIETDPRFLPEVLEGLWRCRQASGQVEAFVHFLHESEIARNSSAGVLKEAELMDVTQVESTPFLAEAFAARPSWSVLQRICERIEVAENTPLAHAMEALRVALREAEGRRARYHCSGCGLTPGVLLWQCPSCRRWGSIAPASDLIAG